MQFTILRKNLLKSIQLVVGVVEMRQTTPILSHLLLDLSQDRLTLTGTDNEIFVTSYAQVTEVIQTGSMTVSALTLLEICRRFPEDAILRFKQEKNNKLSLQSDHIHFKLGTLPFQDFPTTTFDNAKISFSVFENLLYNAIKKTRFAMAHQDIRYYLNGILWDIKHNNLTLVATDGHRLASKRLSIQSEQEKAIIVPRKMIAELVRLLGDSTGKLVNIKISDQLISVQTEEYHIVSRLIGGTFPDYTQLLPQAESERVVVLDRDQFKDALARQAVLLKGKRYKSIQLRLSHNYLKLCVVNLDKDSGEELLSVEYKPLNSEEKEFFISFNIDYLQEVLDVLPSGKINMILPLESGVTFLETINNQDHVYIIMPIADIAYE